MTDRLRNLVGTTLRRQRELHRLTQAQLAARAGVSQATVARVENGGRSPSLAMVDQLLAVLGSQLTVGVEPLDAEVDRRLTELAAQPVAERIADAGLDRAVERLTGLPYVFAGATAALLQGAPLPVSAVEIAVSWEDVDAFTAWLERNYAQRWNERWQEFGYLHEDPRQPGAHRWYTRIGEIRATMCHKLPEPIEVRHGPTAYRVVPLAGLEIADPVVAALLRRYREQQLPAEKAGPATGAKSTAAAEPTADPAASAG
jgi:transcriptional regulator with XRE-family HTH domain